VLGDQYANATLHLFSYSIRFLSPSVHSLSTEQHSNYLDKAHRHTLNKTSSLLAPNTTEMQCTPDSFTVDHPLASRSQTRLRNACNRCCAAKVRSNLITPQHFPGSGRKFGGLTTFRSSAQVSGLAVNDVRPRALPVCMPSPEQVKCLALELRSGQPMPGQREVTNRLEVNCRPCLPPN
jgi:hypothetical protein